MSKPTTLIFPIYNGKLLNELDCNNFQLLNLDTSNLSIIGGGGSGNDTGTTTAILKGDGNHGFADAVSDVDYASIAFVGQKEDITDHDADVATINTDIATINTSLATKATTTALNNYITSNDAALAIDVANLAAYIVSNDADVALKAYTSDITTALGDKADSASVSAALAGKEPLLPTTVNDRYILARRNSSGTDAWYFVDPVTLGTSSQSFTDGVENSSTTFTSATANFVAGDVGKTITGDNIPAATTIASRTNSTTIILSAAATATGSGNNFTILNRLEVGGTGTVTNVALTNNVTALFTSSVTNPTTSPTITLTPAAAVGANTFYGNFTAFSGTAGFGSAASARTSLGGTTAGQALFQVTNPGAISFPQFTALNAAVTRTPAQVLSDIGGESALTFSTPLLRSVSPANVISIQQATTLQSGYLSNSDWTLFNGKPPGTRTIATTAPLTGGGNLSADRTLAIPAATASIDGYLKATDFTIFNNAVPQSRTISATAPLAITNLGQLNANLTLSIPSATTLRDGYLTATDFGNFRNSTTGSVNAGLGGTLVIDAAAAPPVSRVMLNSVLTSTLQVTLPPAANYTSSMGFPYIEFVDISGGLGGAATANFGIVINRLGTTTDLVDGQQSISVPRGVGYLRVNSSGASNRWTTTRYFVDSFKDSTFPDKTVTLDVTNQDRGVPGTLTLARGDSVTVNPTDTGVIGVVKDIGVAGFVTKSRVSPTDLLPRVDDCGTAGVGLTDSPHIVPDTGANAGTIDTVRIVGTMSGQYVIKWPAAGSFDKGDVVRLVDVSGTVNSVNYVNVVSSNSSDTFAGQSALTFDETNGQRVFISDGSGAWSVSTQKTAVDAFTVVSPVGTVFTVVANTGVAKLNAQLNLLNGANELRILNAFDGLDIELVLVQPSSGAAGTLNLPIGSKVSGGGAGVVSLTATNSAIDRLKGNYEGTIGAFLWQPAILNHTSQAVPNAPSVLTATAASANRINLAWTDNSAVETGFAIERAPGLAGTGFTQIATVGPNVVTYADNNLTSNTGYIYQVRAYNAGGYSTYSNTSSATTNSGGPTAEILEWHFNEGSLLSVGSVVGPTGSLSQASWSTSTQSGTGACFAPIAGMANMPGVAVSIVGATGGTSSYSYKVLAWKTSSGKHNAYVGAAVTSAVSQAVLDGTNYNHISWSAVTGADYYEVFRTAVTGGSPSSLGRLTVPGVGTSVPFGTNFLDDKGLLVSGTTPSDIALSTDIYQAFANTPITYTTNQISVSFWAKALYANTGATVGIVSGASTPSTWKISSVNGSLFQILFVGNTGTLVGTVSNSTLNDGTTWHNIVVEMDNSTAGNVTTGPATAQSIRVFFDGNATPRTVTYTGTTRTGATNFVSGSPFVGGSAFVGSIDDVRVYDHLLTTGDISAIFAGGAQ